VTSYSYGTLEGILKAVDIQSGTGSTSSRRVGLSAIVNNLQPRRKQYIAVLSGCAGLGPDRMAAVSPRTQTGSARSVAYKAFGNYYTVGACWRSRPARISAISADTRFPGGSRARGWPPFFGRYRGESAATLLAALRTRLGGPVSCSRAEMIRRQRSRTTVRRKVDRRPSTGLGVDLKRHPACAAMGQTEPALYGGAGSRRLASST